MKLTFDVVNTMANINKKYQKSGISSATESNLICKYVISKNVKIQHFTILQQTCFIIEKLECCLLSALNLYRATSMFRDTRNILSKMSFFVHPKSTIMSKISSKCLISVQNCKSIFFTKC